MAEETKKTVEKPIDPPEGGGDLKDRIVAALKTCFDPEIPVDIHELGLIYGIEVAPEGAAKIRMTLTSPNCPAAQSLPAQVKQKVAAVPGVASAEVELVWEPTWTREMMSEAAKLHLGMF